MCRRDIKKYIITLKEIKSNKELDIVMRVIYIYTSYGHVISIGHVTIFYK